MIFKTTFINVKEKIENWKNSPQKARDSFFFVSGVVFALILITVLEYVDSIYDESIQEELYVKGASNIRIDKHEQIESSH